MATAFTQAYQYSNPEKLDISNTLGKASTYKQSEYNINTMAIQQLVNQYVGTDLLREVDQNYLGERLQTLTNYINQAGTMDWSRKDVYNDVSSYIGQALDSNVMAGIMSTQKYRKHQMQMDDIKKNKPDQYSVQNDWFATRDLQRYLNSNQLGDSYNQGTYVPYTDVKKQLLENSKYLKDFGVETYLDSSDGNVYFKNIKTGERLTRDTANQYVDLVLGESGKNQLMIDGIYNYKNVPDNILRTEYDSFIDSVSKNYSNSAKALRLKSINSPKNIKDQLEKEADSLDAMANDVSTSKGILKDRDSIASNLYLNRFKKQWSDMLSFDRIKDWKIDDSGFQIAKFNQEIRQNDIQNAFKTAELELDKQGLNLRQSELNAKLMADGLKVDSQGNIVEDKTSIRNPLNSGITATQASKDLEELEITPAQQIFADYDTAYKNAITDGTIGLTKVIDDPRNSDLKKALGFEGKDAKYIINSMIINPNSYNKLMNHLDENTKDLIRNAQITYKDKETLKQKASIIDKDIQRISDGIYNTKPGSNLNSFKENYNLFQGGYGIDDKGNLVKRDVRNSNTINDRKVREIGVINNIIAQGGTIDDDKKAILYQKQLDLLKSMKLTPSQYQKAKDKLIYQYEGFFGGLTSEIASGAITMFPSLIGGLKSIDNTINWFNKDNKSMGQSDITGALLRQASGSDLTNNSFINRNNQSSNRRGVSGYLMDQANDLFMRNYDIDDIGDTDLPNLVNGSTVQNRIDGVLNLVKNEAVNIKGRTEFYNNINVDLTSPIGKQIISNLKANLPIGSEIQKEGNVQFRLDSSTGMATVIAPLKNGKEINPVELQIPLQNVPSQILERVNLNKREYAYSANNPNSIGYENFTEIPSTKKEWLSQVNMMPINERTTAVNNPPKTQEDITKEMEFTFGKDIVNKYKAEIKDITNRPIDFNLISENGQWTIVGKQGNEVIMMKPTNQEYIDPKIMDKYLDKLGTEQIIENVKALLKTKQ